MIDLKKIFNPQTENERSFQKRSYVNLISNPPIEALLSKLRDVETRGEDFRRIGDAVARYVIAQLFEILGVSWGVEPCTTKVGHGQALRYQDNFLCMVLARAGLMFLPGLRDLMGKSNEDFIIVDPKRRYRPDGSVYALVGRGQIPEKISATTRILSFDPMAASGSSVIACIDECIRRGATPSNIRIVSLFMVWEFVTALWEKYGHMQIYTSCVNDTLDSHFYICGKVIEPRYYCEGIEHEKSDEGEKINSAPGDAGDRLVDGIEEEWQWRKYYGIDGVGLPPLMEY